jgi:electron transport complex protein RnfE
MFQVWRQDFKRGLWEENPTFMQLIGMCPVLAVSNAAINGVAMGTATTFVLVCSSIVISLLRNVIPDKVRIPAYIVIIATFVTIADLILAAITPGVHKVLGLFIPLIVVNCIILGRQEAFASKMPVGRSIFDALGMGLGFTWAITFLSIIRELIGMGTIFGVQVLEHTPWVIMILPPGAFLTLGILVGLMNTLKRRRAEG